MSSVRKSSSRIGFKDYFNGSNPRGDAVFLPKVNDPELPHLISAVYGTLFPEVPDSNMSMDGVQRSDLVQVFLTGLPGLNKPTDVRRAEMLRLNMDVAPCVADCSTLGAIDGDGAGFSNGRRLSNDIIDIALRVVMGVLIPGHDADGLADGVGRTTRRSWGPSSTRLPALRVGRRPALTRGGGGRRGAAVTPVSGRTQEGTVHHDRDHRGARGGPALRAALFLFHAGRIRLRLGDEGAANVLLRGAFDVNPSFSVRWSPVLRDILKRLRHGQG